MSIYRKITLFVILLSWASGVFAQSIIIEEDFSDGDFTHDPTWSDPEGKHIVNEALRLQLNAPSESAEAVIYTASSAAYGEWEALITLDFNPSGSNLARFYILSDSGSLQGPLRGYYIQIGDTDDEVSLYRQEGYSSTKIIDGTDKLLDSDPVSVRVKATRDLTGRWELFADAAGGRSFLSQGSVRDNTIATGNYIGFHSDYTSTRSNRFEYDDIRVIKMNPPLEVREVSVADNHTLDLIFNLEIDPASVSPADFFVDGAGNPDETMLPSPRVIRLIYDTALPSKRYILKVSTIKDTDGNSIAAHTAIPFTLFGSVVPRDIVINEFMKDPPPGQSEYVELKNTSGKIINLQKWRLGDEGGADILTFEELALEADSFLVISEDTTALFHVYGKRAFYEADFLDTFNNDSDIIQIYDSSGVQLDSLAYTPEWGGKDVSLERRSAKTASTYRENFGESPHPLGGTPGTANEVALDTTPPRLLHLSVRDRQTINLAFSERIDSTAGGSADNFMLDQGIAVSRAQAFSADSIRLSLSSDLQNAVRYRLRIFNQKDVFGNTSAVIDTIFTYYEVSPADTSMVFINEFSYDPPQGSTEYIELYNPTDLSFDIQGWTLNDNTGNRKLIADARTIFPPESFLVLAPDQTLLSSFPGITLITMGSSFPSLNNGGDHIVIRGSEAQILDSLSYSSDYGGEHIALERRSVEVSGNFAENFGDAPNGFGSPGSANGIAPDHSPPSFVRLATRGNSSFELTFSETLDSGSATDAANYIISPSRHIQLISARRDTVLLFVDPVLQSGEVYTITVKNIQDIFGNAIGRAGLETEYLNISEAKPGDLRVNEILYSRASGGGPEFIELYNTTANNFDLEGWLIGDASGSAYIEKGTLRSGEYLVLSDNSSFARSLENGLFIPNFPSLNDSGDSIYIRTHKGVTIDSTAYSPTWGGDQSGVSLERIDPLGASHDPSNYRSSTHLSGHTAGRENSVYEIDREAPRIIFAKSLSGGTTEVQFNEFIRPTEMLSFSSNGSALRILSFDPNAANTIELGAPKTKHRPASPLSLIGRNISDLRGNVNPSDEIPIAQKIRAAEIVINEILFEPLDDPDDNLPDQNEYIELRNTTDAAVSLEGVYIHDAPDEDGDSNPIIPVSTKAKWIPARSTALVYADMSERFEESQTARFFELSSLPEHALMRADRRSLNLAASGDAIFLSDSAGAIIDSVFYDERWHNPNLIDTRGIALERINPTGASDDESNWGSSISPKGGTPMQENTIYQQPRGQALERGITFDPNPFSPDDDGIEDHLFINYRLDEPDYLIKVSIYDRYGRLVRKLTDAQPAGWQGSLIWDGRKDDGSRNRIGIYIVIFKAYNSSSGKERAFKKTVVLARRLK